MGWSDKLGVRLGDFALHGQHLDETWLPHASKCSYIEACRMTLQKLHLASLKAEYITHKFGGLFHVLPSPLLLLRDRNQTASEGVLNDSPVIVYTYIQPTWVEQGQPENIPNPILLQHTQAWGLDPKLPLIKLSSAMRLTDDIPMQMKYASVSLTLRYHFFKLSNPASIAYVMSSNLSCLAIFSHDSSMNSRTRIVCHTVGSLELENVCWALAGSCPQLICLKICE